MAIKKTQRGPASTRPGEAGFALLIAVIFTSVILSFGLSLGSLGYKQVILASSAIESQYAFYAADAALECALYSDQREGNFTYLDHNEIDKPSLITCDNASATRLSYVYNAAWLVDTQRFSLDAGKHCADVTVYKYGEPTGGQTTYIFSQGYNVSCATVASPGGARFSSRGLSFHY